MGIPANLHGILKEEDIQFLAESAFADACRPGNPRDTSVEEIVELYKSQLPIYRKTLVETLRLFFEKEVNYN